MWLRTIERSLDQLTRPVTFFFRDDDAGWSDERLWQLLDVFDKHTATIDLAVIPDALSARTAKALNARKDAAPQRIGLHQHGCRHENHETVGRKCEFGTTREFSIQLEDLKHGQVRLKDLLTDVDPIFTPPWNRCSETTVQCLHALGFAALSRDLGAVPDQTALIELPVHLDWCKYSRTASAPRIEIANRLSSAIAAFGVVGIMLHHAVMEADDRDQLSNLLSLLRGHDNARFAKMPHLIDPHKTTQATCSLA